MDYRIINSIYYIFINYTFSQSDSDTLNGSGELLSLYNKVEVAKHCVSEDRNFPLIVFEGLDGCGMIYSYIIF